MTTGGVGQVSWVIHHARFGSLLVMQVISVVAVYGIIFLGFICTLVFCHRRPVDNINIYIFTTYVIL